MLSPPQSRLAAGLPTSPRPQKNAQSAQYTPVHLPSTSPARSPPGTSSLHTRSRSQPLRIISSPNRGRSSSGTARRYEQDGPAPSSANRQDLSGSLLSVSSRNGLRLKMQSQGQPMAASSTQQPEPETPYTRPTIQKATINGSSGDGYDAIWNTVSSVTSALTISVGKAWSTNIPTFSGEETPPGQESRLTRAMKAYHIAKARTPADLPDWLFDERERRVVNAPPQPNDGVDDQIQASPAVRTNFIRPEVPSGKGQASTTTQHGTSQPLSRGADRLKAMREAKKINGQRDSSDGFTDITRQTYNSGNVPQTATQQPRIGLPSGPQRGLR